VGASTSRPVAAKNPFLEESMNSRKLVIIISQLALLALINRAGYMLAHRLSLRLPGNLVGMLILFALLSSRLVRLEWIQDGATILTRHLAFFFIPIAVGLIAFREVFLQHGLAILGTLIVSATVGILLCGFSAQAFKEKEAKCHEITAGIIRHCCYRVGLRS
jgi:holin-like protein